MHLVAVQEQNPIGGPTGEPTQSALQQQNSWQGGWVGRLGRWGKGGRGIAGARGRGSAKAKNEEKPCHALPRGPAKELTPTPSALSVLRNFQSGKA